jgi:hypothetical protein
MKKKIDACVKELDENITYILENEDNDNGFDVNEFMSDFNDIKFTDESKSYEIDDMYASVTDYDENFTIKQLLQICEFYGFTKEIRIAKGKKLDIIGAIVMFENNPENGAQVYRRKQLWHYISELKSDKFMKKFVLW